MREQEFVSLAKRCAEEPLPIEEVEIDQVGGAFPWYGPMGGGWGVSLVPHMAAPLCASCS